MQEAPHEDTELRRIAGNLAKMVLERCGGADEVNITFYLEGRMEVDLTVRKRTY